MRSLDFLSIQSKFDRKKATYQEINVIMLVIDSHQNFACACDALTKMGCGIGLLISKLCKILHCLKFHGHTSLIAL